jgi:hypothetical protein
MTTYYSNVINDIERFNDMFGAGDDKDVEDGGNDNFDECMWKQNKSNIYIN